MKLTLSAALAIAVLTGFATQTGQPADDLTEYDAVFDDGPYSYLPTPGHGDPYSANFETDASEIITAEEALMTDALLTVLAADPTNPAPQDAPLDAPAPSDTAIVMAGL